jgi:hypothetical protein
MSATDTITSSVTSTSGLSSMQGADNEFGNVEINIPNLAFSANSNSVAFTLAFNASQVQMIFMVATQNCTINTNNSSSPTNTVSLVAGIPLIWGRSAGYFAQPLNANTNGGFLTCNAATILNARILTT